MPLSDYSFCNLFICFIFFNCYFAQLQLLIFIGQTIQKSLAIFKSLLSSNAFYTSLSIMEYLVIIGLYIFAWLFLFFSQCLRLSAEKNMLIQWLIIMKNHQITIGIQCFTQCGSWVMLLASGGNPH